jgi:hypothetical protein
VGGEVVVFGARGNGCDGKTTYNWSCQGFGFQMVRKKVDGSAVGSCVRGKEGDGSRFTKRCEI